MSQTEETAGLLEGQNPPDSQAAEQAAAEAAAAAEAQAAAEAAEAAAKAAAEAEAAAAAKATTKPRKATGEAAVLVDFDVYKVGQVIKGTPRAISGLAEQGVVDNHPDAVAARRAEGADEVTLEA